MNFPVEFNPKIYKNENRHLANMNETQLIEHYNYYGYNQGLISNNIKNRIFNQTLK
jgi:hypothetical protein